MFELSDEDDNFWDVRLCVFPSKVFKVGRGKVFRTIEVSYSSEFVPIHKPPDWTISTGYNFFFIFFFSHMYHQSHKIFFFDIN